MAIQPSRGTHATGHDSGAGATGWQAWRRDLRLEAAVAGSALAALLAIVAILSMGSLYAWHGAQDGWLLSKAPSAIWFGDASTRVGFESATVFTGLAVWLLGAVLFGATFGAAVHRVMPDMLPFVGTGVGVALWSLAMLAGQHLPAAWAAHAQSLMPSWMSFVCYVLFGLAMGVGAMVALFRAAPPDDT